MANQKQFVSFLFIFIISLSIASSQSIRTSFRTTERSIDLEKTADPRVVYLYDEFQRGTVYFSRGTTSQMRLNYRLLVDDMVMMNESGNTRSLIRGAAFDSIRIQEKLFIFHRTYGYLEKVSNDSNNVFIKYQSTHSMEEIIPGAYGQSPASSSTQRVNLISSSDTGGRGPSGRDLRLENLSGAEMEIVITRRPVLVIETDDGYLAFTTRRQLTRVFPDYRREIRNFVRSNSISFDEREDLIKLGRFVTELISEE